VKDEAGVKKIISSATKDIAVSDKNLPYLYDHNMTTLSTVDRIAQVNQQHEWLILGQPRYPFTQAKKISRIVLQFNDEFGYPENTPAWDCTFYGDRRYCLLPTENFCQIERTGAKTLVNIDLDYEDWRASNADASKYDFFKLNVTHPFARFVAPKVSSSIYPTQIFYYAGSQLVETGVVNVSRIQQGEFLKYFFYLLILKYYILLFFSQTPSSYPLHGKLPQR
jgi:hypothetical protein